MIEISKSSQKYQFSNFPPNSIFTNEFFRQHFLLEIASVIDEIGHFRVEIGNFGLEIDYFSGKIAWDRNHSMVFVI